MCVTSSVQLSVLLSTWHILFVNLKPYTIWLGQLWHRIPFWSLTKFGGLPAIKCIPVCLLQSGSPYITMVALSFKRLFTSLSVLVSLAVVNSTPTCLHDSYTDLNAAQAAFNLLSDAKNAAPPPPPHFVIYGDKFVSGQTGPPPVADIKVRSPIFRSSLTL